MYSQSFIINFIFYLILCVTLISLILYLLTFYAQLSNNNLNLYKYKISNFFITIMMSVFYIIIFIIFFYCLRLYNIGNYLDLKQAYLTFILIWKIFVSPLNFIIQIFLFIYLSIFVILIILVFKFILLQVFKIYLYIYFNPKIIEKQRGLGFFFFLSNNDIISYTIYKIIYNFLLNIKRDYFFKYYINYINNYLIYNDKYKLFMTFSPFFIILYDCIFNNFIVIHFYYYMIVYTPVMLLKKITMAITNTNEGFARILWHIYYNRDLHIYFVANKEQKNIIDILLQANLGYVTEFLLDMVEFYLQGSITYKLQDLTNNIYCNNDANYLRIENKKIYKVMEDENENVFYEETKEYIFL